MSIHKSVSLFLSAFLLLIGAVGSHAQTFNGSGFTIVDNSVQNPNSCSVVTVSGIAGSVNLSRVTYQNLNHTFAGDLELSVQSPIVNDDAFIGSMVSFPDSRPCDLSGNYTFLDSASISLAAATNNCTDNQVIAGGNYLPSNYGGPTIAGANTSFAADFGVLSAAQVNGDWLVCAFDFAPGNVGTVGGVTLSFTPFLTAAGAQIGGTVISKFNRPVANAVVTLTNTHGSETTVKTNAFGKFRFDDVPTGQVYVIGVSAKRYSYLPQTIDLNQNLTDLVFAGN